MMMNLCNCIYTSMNVPHVNVNPALFFLECKVFFNVVTVDTVYFVYSNHSRLIKLLQRKGNKLVHSENSFAFCFISNT